MNEVVSFFPFYFFVFLSLLSCFHFPFYLPISVMSRSVYVFRCMRIPMSLLLYSLAFSTGG